MKKVNVMGDPVPIVLRNLAVPMIAGMLGMVIFNLTDTYFVGKLGLSQMAALSFTFPVVMVIGSINLGIGIGAAAVISKAIGEKNQNKVVKLATDAISLGVAVSIIVMLLGFLTLNPLFTLLGAEGQTLSYIKEYMVLYYIGVPFVVIPMIGNNTIRALGDTKIPSVVMLVAAILNAVLDPLLIQGLWFFPEMGIRGAALATVFSRFITMVVSLYILIYREKVLNLAVLSWNTLLEGWKQILFIGLPNAVAKMIIPISAGIITAIIAVYGDAAVAAYGIATRLEFLSLAILQALIAIIPVFVGQHYGAKLFERISLGIKQSVLFAMFYGFLILGLYMVFGSSIAWIFTDSETVHNQIMLYMKIVPFGYGFMGVLLLMNAAFNALHKPYIAASLSLIQTFLLYIPLAYLFGITLEFGLAGIFASLGVSYVIVGSGSYLYFHKFLVKLGGGTV